jgi:hypothetical protein
MSVEVKPAETPTTLEPAAAATASTPSAPKRLALWQRRRLQIAGGLVVIALIAAFVGNNLLARQYTPDGVVRQYLTALQADNAASAWSVMQVSAPSQPIAATLTNQAALQAALASSKPDIRSFVVNAPTQINPNQSTVDVTYATASGSQQAKFVVQRSAETHFLLYPGWNILITPALLQIAVPMGSSGVLIDGKAIDLPAGTSTVAVLPVLHRIQFTGSEMLATKTVSVDAFSSLSQVVTSAPTLTSSGLANAKAAVKAFLAACAQQTSLQPDKCPQQYSNGFVSSVRWQVLGDPTQDLTISFDQDLKATGAGHFQMVVVYQEPGASGTSHEISAGGYVAALALTTSNVTVASISSSSNVPPVQRPAGATDQAAIAQVSKALGACASATVPIQADCPQSLLSGVAENVRWKLNGDPTSGATVSFDSSNGIFTVHGQMNMVASYSINGYATTDPSVYNAYDAYLLWDGQALQLVTISGAFS